MPTCYRVALFCFLVTIPISCAQPMNITTISMISTMNTTMDVWMKYSTDTVDMSSFDISKPKTTISAINQQLKATSPGTTEETNLIAITTGSTHLTTTGHQTTIDSNSAISVNTTNTTVLTTQATTKDSPVTTTETPSTEVHSNQSTTVSAFTNSSFHSSAMSLTTSNNFSSTTENSTSNSTVTLTTLERNHTFLTTITSKGNHTNFTMTTVSSSHTELTPTTSRGNYSTLTTTSSGGKDTTTAYNSTISSSSTSKTTVFITTSNVSLSDKGDGQDVQGKPQNGNKSVVIGAIIGVVLATLLVMLGAFYLCKKAKPDSFNHRRLYEDISDDPVLRLDNSPDALDLRYDGSAYYNPTVTTDSIKMDNIGPQWPSA
ncbi:mucin-15 [Polypterus senegalus]|uniref:mucin-15 n=1 Tax=Polypterus senegalus TaxID=55291 RepID=UPI0019666FBE|nr:mucin-15 [Polypterus senegalus]